MLTDDPPVSTGADQAGSRIEQLTIFIGDRLGALHRALQTLDARHIRICALSILESVDHAVVRLVVDRPSVAARLLEEAGYVAFRRALLGVALPRRAERDIGVRGVLQALLSAEVKVNYVYPLVVAVEDRFVLALNVESLEVAERAVVSAGLEVVDHDQLGWGKDEE